MSTEREQVDAQERIHLQARHAIGPAELKILFNIRSDYAALKASHDRLKVAAEKSLELWTEHDIATLTKLMALRAALSESL